MIVTGTCTISAPPLHCLRLRLRPRLVCTAFPSFYRPSPPRSNSGVFLLQNTTILEKQKKNQKKKNQNSFMHSSAESRVAIFYITFEQEKSRVLATRPRTTQTGNLIRIITSLLSSSPSLQPPLSISSTLSKSHQKKKAHPSTFNT